MYSKTTTITTLTDVREFSEILTPEQRLTFEDMYREKYQDKAEVFQFVQVDENQTQVQSIWSSKEFYETVFAEWEEWQRVTYGTSIDAFYTDESKFILEIKFEEI